ncbi:MAG: hypothetical protein ACRDCM_06685, partial [Plesiomonas shigelloides]
GVFILLLSFIFYLLSLVPLLIGLGALVPLSSLHDEYTGICRRQGFAVFAVGCGEIAAKELGHGVEPSSVQVR